MAAPAMAPIRDEPKLQPVSLKPGPEWASFEQFRIAGSAGVEAVGGGQIGTLRTKTGVFRVLRDEDFQVLVGLASEVTRLKGGLATMVQAAKVVRDHPASPSAFDLLLHLAAQYGDAALAAVEPEMSPAAGDDEFIVDPAELKRRVTRR